MEGGKGGRNNAQLAAVNELDKLKKHFSLFHIIRLMVEQFRWLTFIELIIIAHNSEIFKPKIPI